MILAQDGYGPVQKIDGGFDVGYLDGAVLSIKNRKPDTLPRTVSGMLTRYPRKELFLDLHFYASQMAMTRPGRILDYRLYNTGLTRKDFLSSKSVINYAHRLIDYQHRLGLLNVILPGLTITNFNANSALLSLQLYQTSLEYIKEIGPDSDTKALLSLTILENALLDDEQLSKFLDEVTLLENVGGYYIVVERSYGSLPQWQDSRTLAKLMYVVNTLSENSDVVCGFIDFPGLLLLAVGAKHIASGWYQTLRHYTSNYFKKTGGQPTGAFRYASKELLTQLISVPDLRRIVNKGLNKRFVDPKYGRGLQDPDNLVLNQPSRVLHQWKVFHELGEQIVAATDPLGKIEQLIETAENNLKSLRQEGINIEQNAVSHYEVWKKAIAAYRDGVLS